MKIKKRLLVLVSHVLLISSVLILSSCTGKTSNLLTLTFTPQGCLVETKHILDPEFSVDWVIQDDATQEYVYVLLTLDDGRNRDDLEAWLHKSTEHPTWATILGYNITNEGGKTISQKHDLSANAFFDGNPLYIICSIGDRLFVEGPIKMSKER